jgi:hypothetical protein
VGWGGSPASRCGGRHGSPYWWLRHCLERHVPLVNWTKAPVWRSRRRVLPLVVVENVDQTLWRVYGTWISAAHRPHGRSRTPVHLDHFCGPQPAGPASPSSPIAMTGHLQAARNRQERGRRVWSTRGTVAGFAHGGEGADVDEWHASW